MQNHHARILRTLGTAALAALALALLLPGCRQWPNCKKDKHCAKFETREAHGTPFCVDNRCVSCRNGDDCPEGQQCDDGACEPIPGYCNSDTDCPSPQRCWNNRCGPQCRNNDDCAQGEVCDAGRCIVPECLDDSACPPGHQCRNYRCEALPAPREACPNREFHTVLFDFDEHVLRSDQVTNADYNVTCMTTYDGNVTIEGHCDERGTEEYNLALGERRARTVKQYAQNHGIDAGRLRTVSYGESRPAERGHSETAWSRNRRAVFVWAN